MVCTLEEQMDSWVEGYKCRRVTLWMNRWVGEQMDSSVEGYKCTAIQIGMNISVEEQMDNWEDGYKCKRIKIAWCERWKNRWIVEQKITSVEG